jgi:8-oxo-dGTP pyrophosphatase MutT (NUDIX family)
MSLANKPIHPELVRITKIIQNSLNENRSNCRAEYAGFNKNNLIAPKKAAVLVPLLLDNDEIHLLFTRRNENLAEHSGQVSFPGGSYEFGDDFPAGTAKREAYEETGLLPEDIIVIGQIPEILSITNYCVTPVVGSIPWPYNFSICKVEVSKIFTIPLKWLSNPSNRRLESKLLPDGEQIEVIYFNRYAGELLWGLTARLVLNFLALID